MSACCAVAIVGKRINSKSKTLMIEQNVAILTIDRVTSGSKVKSLPRLFYFVTIAFGALAVGLGENARVSQTV